VDDLLTNTQLSRGKLLNASVDKEMNNHHDRRLKNIKFLLADVVSHWGKRAEWLYLNNKSWIFHHITVTHPGRTCQPGSGSCGWGRSSWCGNGAECRPSPPRWPAPAAGTYVRGATGPAAAEWVCASRGQLLGPLTRHRPQRPCPPTLPAAASGTGCHTNTQVRYRLEYQTVLILDFWV